MSSWYDAEMLTRSMRVRLAFTTSITFVIFAGCGSPAPEEAVVASSGVESSVTASSEPEAPSPRHDGPFLRVLGIAQDGGFPHAACEHELCRRARVEPDLASPVASLGLVVPRPDGGKGVYLVDATPDVRQQLDLLRDVRDRPGDRVDRAPLDGVLLTHAHIGHYLGLAFFGFEAVHTRGLPLHVTPRMADFLRANGPWDQLVEKGNIAIVAHAPDAETFTLDGITVRMIGVPHRDEYSDTVGFLFAGPSRRVFYVPDTDTWDTWRPGLIDVLEGHDVDVAILDGSFYSLDELPGRDISQVRHPLVIQTMDLLAAWVAGGGRAIFSHLNHSNPALDPGSDERSVIESRGFEVATVGLEIEL